MAQNKPLLVVNGELSTASSSNLDSDTLLYQNFDTSSVSDFTQIGLTFETVAPINGYKSAKFIHDSVTLKYLQETIPLPLKFRNIPMTMFITGSSLANLGNVIVEFHDVTNNSPIGYSQQLHFEQNIKSIQLGFKIPENCASIRYKISALPQAGSPVTLIDDIKITNYWIGSSVEGQTKHELEVPLVTEWQPYAPTFTGLGTITGASFFWRQNGSNVEVEGYAVSGSVQSALASMSLPNSYISVNSLSGRQIGTWGRTASASSHGGFVLGLNSSNVVAFSADLVFSGQTTLPHNQANGNQMVNNSETFTLKFSVPIFGLKATTTKSFISTDIVPAKAMSGSTSIDVPIITDPIPFIPTGSWTNTSYTGKWHREGSHAVIYYYLVLSGTPTGSLVLNVPGDIGLLDNSVPVSATKVGEGYGNGTTGTFAVHAWMNNASNNTLTVNYEATVAGTNPQPINAAPAVNATSPVSWTSGNWIEIIAKVPILGWEATETKTWSSTQQAITEITDSEVMATGFTGYGSTATTTIRFSNGSSIGSSIQYVSSAIDGDSFVALEDGIYEASLYVSSNTSATYQRAFIAIQDENNSGIVSFETRDTVNTATTGKHQTVSVSKYLKAGWKFRFVSDASLTLVNAAGIVTKQGKLKKLETISDQKIKIPIHEVRLEGTSSRGTGAESSTVKFDAIAKFIGDGISLDQTNGTIISIKKYGLLHVTASVYFSGGGASLNLSYNGSYITEGYSNATQNFPVVTQTLNVKPGDIIKIIANVNPTSEPQNNISLVLQEQEVAVSVTNILPQFSDEDSCVRVFGANGFGSVGNKIRRFSSVQQNLGKDVDYIDSASNGGSFIIRTPGTYSITYSDLKTVAGVGYIGISRNSSNLTASINSFTSFEEVLNITSLDNTTNVVTTTFVGYLNEGDVIRAHSTGDLGTGLTGTNFQISKIGKPNVTGVDVTPFINIPKTTKEFLNAYRGSFGSTATSLLTLSGAVIRTNTLSSIIKYTQNTVNGDTFTALKKCTIHVGWHVATIVYSNAAGEIRLLKNDTTGSAENSLDYAYCNVQTNGGPERNSLKIAGVFNLEIGDVIRFWAQTGSSLFDQNGTGVISIMAEADTDTVLTEVDTFSTDVNTLTYASSSTYTLSTLANAPIGTFITFECPINTSIITAQTTVAPSQSSQSMNADGILLTKRTYATASAAATPGKFAIQIGKGHKGVDIRVYKTSGKTRPMASISPREDGSVSGGLLFKEYDPKTGIIVIDAASVTGSGNTFNQWLFDDSTNATTGYIEIHASKNPSFIGFNLGAVAARYTTDTLSSIGTTNTLINYEDKVFDTHNTYSGGIYTVQENGYYQVNAGYITASVTITTTGATQIFIYVNGVAYSASIIRGNGASTSYSPQINDLIYLKKGDQVSIYGTASVATTIGASIANFFSIARLR